MQVPALIMLRVRADREANLSDMIIELKVSTGHKNPYSICFPKTDLSGYAELTRSDFIGQFKDHWEIGLMDYSGGPKDASPVVVVSLFDSAWLEQNRLLALKWDLLKHEKTKWQSRAEQFAYMTSSRNNHFTCNPHTVDLHKTSDILLNLLVAQ